MCHRTSYKQGHCLADPFTTTPACPVEVGDITVGVKAETSLKLSSWMKVTSFKPCKQALHMVSLLLPWDPELQSEKQVKLQFYLRLSQQQLILCDEPAGQLPAKNVRILCWIHIWNLIVPTGRLRDADEGEVEISHGSSSSSQSEFEDSSTTQNTYRAWAKTNETPVSKYDWTR